MIRIVIADDDSRLAFQTSADAGAAVSIGSRSSGWTS
jgi:hypothetical protein